MGDRAKVRYYFLEGWAVDGRYSLAPAMMSQWRRAYVLWGGPGSGKATLIKMIGLELQDRGYEIDFWRSALDPDTTAGFWLHPYGIVLLNPLEMSPLPWQAPGLIERFIDFTQFCNLRKLQSRRRAILDSLVKQKQWETKLIELITHQYYDPYIRTKPADPLLHLIMEEQRVLGSVRQYYWQGVTEEGWLNLAPHFLSECDQICLPEKDAMAELREIILEVRLLGQAVDYVYHPLNPGHLIGIVLPERHLAIWQGDPRNLEDLGMQADLHPQTREAIAAWKMERRNTKTLFIETMDFAQIDAYRAQLLQQIIREIEQ
ncbi:MAG: hypothetical protein LBT32_06560 [Peptococcaceae bacterium]|jgi:hypothetical protein|nr:hypothetical protein [Peptococcaceae bacterium]